MGYPDMGGLTNMGGCRATGAGVRKRELYKTIFVQICGSCTVFVVFITWFFDVVLDNSIHEAIKLQNTVSQNVAPPRKKTLVFPWRHAPQKTSILEDLLVSLKGPEVISYMRYAKHTFPEMFHPALNGTGSFCEEVFQTLSGALQWDRKVLFKEPLHETQLSGNLPVPIERPEVFS